jgi:DNA modification methylase
MSFELYNEDSFSLLSKFIIEGRNFDLIHIDPPYDISCTNRGGTLNNLKKFNKSTKILEDEDISSGYNITKCLDILKKLQKNINIYIWTNKVYIPKYIDYYVNNLGCLFDILIWNKVNAVPSYSHKYLTDCEYLLYFKERGSYNNPSCYNDAKTVFIDKINIQDKKLYSHPTIKPLSITESTIRNSCPPSGTVLDCFMGSGTTGVACKRNGFNFVGIEKSKKYFDIANNRINECSLEGFM